MDFRSPKWKMAVDSRQSDGNGTNVGITSDHQASKVQRTQARQAGRNGHFQYAQTEQRSIAEQRMRNIFLVLY